MENLVGTSPETNTDVLRIDDDFECGDVLVFTFTPSGANLDFDASVTAIPFTVGE